MFLSTVAAAYTHLDEFIYVQLYFPMTTHSFARIENPRFLDEKLCAAHVYACVQITNPKNQNVVQHSNSEP